MDNQILLNINDSSKLAFFLEVIKKFDFVSVNKVITNNEAEGNTTKDYSLTSEQIRILEDRKQKHINNESSSFDWEDIKQELKSL